MGADAYYYQNFGLAGTAFIGRIGRLLRLLGIGIPEERANLGQALQHGLRAAQYPDWLATPAHPYHFTRLELADIRLYGSTQGLCPGTGLPGRKKWYCGKACANCTCYRGSHSQEVTPALVNALAHRWVS
jgi:hypothetical protein